MYCLRKDSFESRASLVESCLKRARFAGEIVVGVSWLTGESELATKAKVRGDKVHLDIDINRSERSASCLPRISELVPIGCWLGQVQGWARLFTHQHGCSQIKLMKELGYENVHFKHICYILSLNIP